MKTACFALNIIICLSLLTFGATAQNYDPAKVKKKAVQLYNQALEKAEDGNLALAASLFLKSIETDNAYVDAYLSLAGVYGQEKNYQSSVDYYEKAFALDSDYTIEFKLSYSINLAGMGRFRDALNAINYFLDKKPPRNSTALKAAEYRKRCYEFAVDYAKKHPDTTYVFAPKNIGDGVNTAESEYFPSLTIDGKELVFTRRVKGFNEDFYYSKKKFGEWDLAKPMEGDINTPQNEGAQNISQDGQWLVFTGCNRPDGFGSCDIYISYLTPQGWSEAINLGGTVNSDQWESQPCLSPDKKDLYFASRRPGGYGGSDIYVSHLQPNGRWSEPENLGPSVNTPGDEQCPFIHADNQTLYFTSNYWPGYGDDDLFYVRKGPNGAWSEPVNLGYPINTINREGTLFITADGKTAYYSSDRSDSRGGLDIYSFELREDIRPKKTLWVRGHVFDNKTGKGLPSAVELIDLTTKESVSKIQTDETGNYLVTLPVGKDYAFNVNRKGYLFYSDNFLLSLHSPDSTYEKNIALQPIEINASVVLKNIFFDLNKYDLKPESQVELDKLIQLLNENPNLKVEISGHTDNVGSPADNLVLSNNRAKAVVNYLVSKGINTNRLSFKGYGETKPIADNKTDEGRAQNRRTEMKVTGQ
ncbi:MAG: flagellar motor protein MotB [Sphingobacteriales bacterium UTBCD1]|jgi:outer membrane protein OmpA-like peptidoglycan-associated protein/tetratricopeptide (TPR) repeat protein|nr:MAG: flagellar motor protein MotB [Sphingobacteriales bacterium UTBCD1]